MGPSKRQKWKVKWSLIKEKGDRMEPYLHNTSSSEQRNGVTDLKWQCYVSPSLIAAKPTALAAQELVKV